MTKQEIEFLRAAGFTLGEIMAMQPKNDPAPVPTPTQPAKPAPTQPAEPAPASAPAPAPDAAGSAEVQKILGQILAAIQSGNRKAASIEPAPKLTPEEIAGKLY